MVVKRNERQVHETIKMDNGVDVHFYDNTDSLENLKKYEDESKKDYDNNPCLLYKVEYVYAKADRTVKSLPVMISKTRPLQVVSSATA